MAIFVNPLKAKLICHYLLVNACISHVYRTARVYISLRAQCYSPNMASDWT